MKGLKSLGLFVVALVALVAAGCDNAPTVKTGDTVIHDGNVTDQSVQAFNKSQPLHTYTYSQEREQLMRRLDKFNRPDVISYITLINYGKVFRYCVVKGKVSSMNSLVSNPQQIVKVPLSGSGYQIELMPSPDLDGSYGDNPKGIFFWTSDGEYVEWAGDFLLSDRPQTLSTPADPVITVK